MGRLTVAVADASTTIAIEAMWDWWWELAFLAFLWSRLFFEEEGPSLLFTDDESAPFCLENLGALPFRFIADKNICDMGLVWAAPTAMVELGQNGLSDRVEGHVSH